jgi:hypothetical protein
MYIIIKKKTTKIDCKFSKTRNIFPRKISVVWKLNNNTYRITSAEQNPLGDQDFGCCQERLL